jgi:hypothetical protein
MPAVVALLVALTVAADTFPQSQAPVVPAASVSAPAASGSKTWLGRETEFEEFLKTAPISRIEEVPIGVTKPVRAYFEPGGLAASVVFKALRPGRSSGGFFESYKSEIAAYELDKLLGLGMVPPTVERRAKHDVGSAQLWVEDCVWLKTKDPNTSGDIGRWNRQVYRHRVWDNLTGNIDRNEGNLLVDPNWNLILIDHSRAFTSTTKMPFPMTRIDRPFYEKLKALTEDDLKAHLDGLLFDGPKSLLKRRDLIVKHFEKLIKEKGEAAVLIP